MEKPWVRLLDGCFVFQPLPDMCEPALAIATADEAIELVEPGFSSDSTYIQYPLSSIVNPMILVISVKLTLIISLDSERTLRYRNVQKNRSFYEKKPS